VPVYTINGQSIHVIEEGTPGRQVALLIHGWSSSWYAMSPLVGLLSQRFRVIAVDLPGYGQSPRLPERTTIPQYADLLAELIAQVSNGPAVLVGHSMGGMTSVTLALRHPVLVERMVLLGPTITGKLSNYINAVVSPITLLERFGLGSLIVSFVERGIVGLSDRIMRPASFAERTDITQDDYVHLREDARRPGQGKVRAECYYAMRENNLSGQLAKVEPPALVIWGAEDNTVPLRDAGVVADEWPTADLRILPKAGHWTQFEAPQTTRRLIAAYLGLPLSSDKINTPVDDKALVQIRDIAQFLAHSDIANSLNLAQRIRLAAQCAPRSYAAGETIAGISQSGSELYVVYSGTLEVWSDPDGPGVGSPDNKQLVTHLRPGTMTGEYAMFDQGVRSADLVAGKSGATVLAFDRERLLALCEDDAVLGTRLLWNIGTAMTQRVRFIIWQLQRASRRMEAAKHAQEQEGIDPTYKHQPI
jgi:pimeloyl-ACP methyl ester carboxylesterase/CRP-like cAMP-binding protein